MKKLKLLLCTSALCLSAISFSPILTASAAELPVTSPDSEANAIGGWDEENGYFTNPEAYANAIDDISTYASPSDPHHTGRSEKRTYNGSTQKRAHGWTSWANTYHYTRARMEDWSLGVLTDSGRQWGTSNTEAISPWWTFKDEILGNARTYYGN